MFRLCLNKYWDGDSVPFPRFPLTDLPLASSTLPGGKSARKEFLLSRGKLRFAKIHPRTAHVAAADL